MPSAPDTARRSFQMLPVVLDTGESLPTLVDAASWTPLRLPLRWAVRARRLTRASSTLEQDLRSVARLYSWAESRGVDLDALLLSGRTLDKVELASLVEYLRWRYDAERPPPRVDPAEAAVVPTGSARFDRHLEVVFDFLEWCLDWSNRGGWWDGPDNPPRLVGPIGVEAVDAERRALRAGLTARKVGAKRSDRHVPLDDAQDALLRTLLDPAWVADGQPTWPLAFSHSVFGRRVALRNWLMVRLARDYGLRLGELLTLRIGDHSFRTSADGGLVLRVIRSPDSKLERRKRKPAAKTCEREFEVAHAIQLGIRAYLTTPPARGGRVSGQGPYLFTSSEGPALTVAGAEDVMEDLNTRLAKRGHHGLKLKWHRLRHSWAEEVAEELLGDDADPRAKPDPQWIEKLRYLGGWVENSKEPLHYIQRALNRRAQNFVRRRNTRLYRIEDPEVRP